MNYLLLVFLSFAFIGLPLFAQFSQFPIDDSGGISIARNIAYNKALNDLEFGQENEKLRAISVLRVGRHPRFIRPLTNELLRGLRKDEKHYFHYSTETAHIKSSIALALGYISHPVSVPKLLEALDLSAELSRQEIAKAKNFNQEAKEKSLSPLVDKILMVPDVPGPFFAKNNTRNNYLVVDRHWSLSEQYQTSKMLQVSGANYINLVRAICIALVGINNNSNNIAQRINNIFDDKKNPDFVRVYAAFALGELAQLGTVDKNKINLDKYIKELGELESKKESSIPLKIATSFIILSADNKQALAYRSLSSLLRDGTMKEKTLAADAFEKLSIKESLGGLKLAYYLENEGSVRKILKRVIKNIEKNVWKERHFQFLRDNSI